MLCSRRGRDDENPICHRKIVTLESKRFDDDQRAGHGSNPAHGESDTTRRDARYRTEAENPASLTGRQHAGDL
jgi:hypothetical protein